MKKPVSTDQKLHKTEEENYPYGTRASELSMYESEKYRRNHPGMDSVERAAKAREAFEQHVKRPKLRLIHIV